MKILFVTTVSNTINAFLLPQIEMLVKQGHSVHISCNVVNPLSSNLYESGCRIYNVPLSRSPLSYSNIVAYRKLRSIIRANSYDVIHCHTPVAAFFSRIACIRLRRKGLKVIYTSHGFHFFRGAPLKNWLIYYPLEKACSYFTDIIVTINREDYQFALYHLNSKAIYYIPSIGIDMEKYSLVQVDRIAKRKSLNVPADSFVVLSVGELNSNKNHQAIIKALSLLKYNNIYYVICGNGDRRRSLQLLARRLGIEDRVILLGYRNDVNEIYRCADIFAFPSRREGLGLAAIEAMASGLPIITSNVHGINDYSIDGQTGFKCAANDYRALASAIEKLYFDKDLRSRMGNYNQEKAKSFDLSISLRLMEGIYRSL